MYMATPGTFRIREASVPRHSPFQPRVAKTSCNVPVTRETPRLHGFQLTIRVKEDLRVRALGSYPPVALLHASFQQVNYFDDLFFDMDFF